jgi:hypothetical protein
MPKVAALPPQPFAALTAVLPGNVKPSDVMERPLIPLTNFASVALDPVVAVEVGEIFTIPLPVV